MKSMATELEETLATKTFEDDPDTMGMILNLQSLDVPEDDFFFGNSCTSTIGSNCCNN